MNDRSGLGHPWAPASRRTEAMSTVDSRRGRGAAHRLAPGGGRAAAGQGVYEATPGPRHPGSRESAGWRGGEAPRAGLDWRERGGSSPAPAAVGRDEGPGAAGTAAFSGGRARRRRRPGSCPDRCAPRAGMRPA